MIDTPKEIQWQPLNRRRVPPEHKSFLLWLGLNDPDGGFPAIAQMWRDECGNPYIRMKVPGNTWKIYFECEWKGMMWAEIPMPERARMKQERNDMRYGMARKTH